MENKYKYTAFISYRHLEPDKQVADKLQRMLENYTPPKKLYDKRKNGSWKIFRDETELPTSSDLSGGIREALEKSEFLIVICSKKLKESIWCMEEIDYFKELHNGNNSKIITLLVNGDPHEAFPEQLCHQLVPITDENGNVTYKDKLIEPLAANVSADTTEKCLKNLKTEFLRIVAPLLGCGYDDLYKREQKKKIRRWLIAGASLFAVLASFLIYNSAMLFKINGINSQLEIKTAEAIASQKATEEANYNLKIKASDVLANQALIYYDSGKLIEAAQYSHEALAVDIPPNPTAQRILSDILGVYDPSSKILESSVKLSGFVSDFAFTEDASRLLAIDVDGNIYVIDFATSEIIKSYYAYADFKSNYLLNYSYLIEGMTAYVVYNDTILAIDLTDGSTKWKINNDSLYFTDCHIYSNPNSDVIYVTDFSKYVIISKDSNIVKLEAYPQDMSADTTAFLSENDDLFVFFDKNNSFAVINKNKAEAYTLPFNSEITVVSACEKDKNIYALAQDGENTIVFSVTLSDGTLNWSTVCEEATIYFSYNNLFPFKHKMYVGEELMTLDGIVLASNNTIFAFDKNSGERYFFKQLPSLIRCEPNKSSASLKVTTKTEYIAETFLYTPTDILYSRSFVFDAEQKGIIVANGTSFASFGSDSSEIITYHDYSYKDHKMLDIASSYSVSNITHDGSVLAVAERVYSDSSAKSAVTLFDVEENSIVSRIELDFSINTLAFANELLYAFDFNENVAVIDKKGTVLHQESITSLLSPLNDKSYFDSSVDYCAPRSNGLFIATSDAMYLLTADEDGISATRIIGNTSIEFASMNKDTVSFIRKNYNTNTSDVCYFKSSDTEYTVIPDGSFEMNSVNLLINNSDSLAFNSPDGYIGYYKIGEKSFKKLEYPLGEVTPQKILFSPDGKYLIILASGSKIFKLDVESGEFCGEFVSGIDFNENTVTEFINGSDLLIKGEYYSGDGIVLNTDKMLLEANIKNILYHVDGYDLILFKGSDRLGFYNLLSDKELLDLGKTFIDSH